MRYILKNIRNTTAKTPMFAFLLVLCLSVSTFVILYSHGAFQNYKTEKIMEEKKLETEDITIDFDSDNPSTAGEFRQFVSMLSEETKEGFKGFFFYAVPDRTKMQFWTDYIYDDYVESRKEFDEEAELSGDKEKYYEDNGMDINAPLDPTTDYSINYPLFMFRLEYHSDSGEYGLYSEYLENQTITEGRMITEDEEESGAAVAVFPPNGADFVGKSVDILGKEYTVIGTEGDGMISEILVPFNSVSDDLTFDFLGIMVSDVMTTPVYEDLKSCFETVYGDRAQFPELETVDVTEVRYYNSIMAIAVIIAIISAVNLAVLFRYILSSRNKSLSVMRIYGCTKNKARVMYIAEIICVSAAIYWICAYIYSAVFLPWLTNFYQYIKEVYTAKTYLCMFGIYIAAIYLSANIMTVIHLHKAPISMLKERGR
jgi:hypothetical protein